MYDCPSFFTQAHTASSCVRSLGTHPSYFLFIFVGIGVGSLPTHKPAAFPS